MQNKIAYLLNLDQLHAAWKKKTKNETKEKTNFCPTNNGFNLIMNAYIYMLLYKFDESFSFFNLLPSELHLCKAQLLLSFFFALKN